MMKKTFAFMIVSAMIVATGCGGAPEVKKEPEKKPVLSKSDQLRQKAKFTEAASMVGYDGKAIKANLNKLIDESERSAKELEDLKGF